MLGDSELDDLVGRDVRPDVLRELRRARRHLIACVREASDEQLERPARREGACMTWHLGHAAFLERAHLGRLVAPLAADWEPRVLAFGPQSADQLEGDMPPMAQVLAWLAASRRVTEALVTCLDLDERTLDVLRDIVNADHAQARYLRARRREMGLPAVAEPRSALLVSDTDCELPPRQHLVAWPAAGPATERPRAGASGAQVVSLDEHRQARSLQELGRGHALVQAGDLHAALHAFEESARHDETADALTYQAWMHSLLGDPATAERLCLRAIRLDPDFGNPYNDIGTICLLRRDVPAAIEWFQRAKRAPRYEPRHFPFLNLGRLYMTLGMPREAISELEGALALSPGSDDIRSLLDAARTQLREG